MDHSELDTSDALEVDSNRVEGSCNTNTQEQHKNGNSERFPNPESISPETKSNHFSMQDMGELRDFHTAINKNEDLELPNQNGNMNGYVYFNILDFKSKEDGKSKKCKLYLFLDKTRVWKIKLPLIRNVEKSQILGVQGHTQMTLKLITQVAIVKSCSEKVTWNLKELRTRFPYDYWKDFTKDNRSTETRVHVRMMFMRNKDDFKMRIFVNPMHFFIEVDDFDSFMQLESKHMNDLDEKNRYPLNYAIELNKFNFVEMIFQTLKKEHLSAPVMKMGETVLHWGARYCHDSKNFATLMRYCSDQIEAVEFTCEQFPLHYAARYNNIEAIKQLLRAGAHIEFSDANGRTALICSILDNCIEAMALLIEKGADIYHKYNHTAAWELALSRESTSSELSRRFMQIHNADHRLEFFYRKKFPFKKLHNIGNLSADPSQCAQIIVTTPRNVKCVILILIENNEYSSENAEYSGPLYPFIMVKSDQAMHNEPAYSRKVVAFGDCKPLKIYLEPSNYYYIIPFVRAALGCPLRLLILCNKKKKLRILEARPWAYRCTAVGKWVGKREGEKEDEFWEKKLRYEVIFPNKNDVKFLIVISQSLAEENEGNLSSLESHLAPFKNTIGFDLFYKKTLRALERPVFSNAKDVHMEYTLDFEKENSLIVVPSCLLPDESKFTLTIFCDDEIQLSQHKKNSSDRAPVP